eukprot:jgi/Picsp_1/5559/NSC_02918-R1_acyl- n-acyltransferases-containing protein
MDIANVHCESFYGEAGAFWDTLLRADRLLSFLPYNNRQKRSKSAIAMAEKHDDTSHDGMSQTITSMANERVCIVSIDTRECTTRTSKESETQSATSGSNIILQKVLIWVTKHALRATKEEDQGMAAKGTVVGAIVVDATMSFIPSRFSWTTLLNSEIPPRRVMAYISNLAISPKNRRKGIATRLVAAAEQHAAGHWHCRSIALHVDPSNHPAYKLYKSMGYRKVSQQTAWQTFIEGRSNPLVLMVKRL